MLDDDAGEDEDEADGCKGPRRGLPERAATGRSSSSHFLRPLRSLLFPIRASTSGDDSRPRRI